MEEVGIFLYIFLVILQVTPSNTRKQFDLLIDLCNPQAPHQLETLIQVTFFPLGLLLSSSSIFSPPSPLSLLLSTAFFSFFILLPHLPPSPQPFYPPHASPLNSEPILPFTSFIVLTPQLQLSSFTLQRLYLTGVSQISIYLSFYCCCFGI